MADMKVQNGSCGANISFPPLTPAKYPRGLGTRLNNRCCGVGSCPGSGENKNVPFLTLHKSKHQPLTKEEPCISRRRVCFTWGEEGAEFTSTPLACQRLSTAITWKWYVSQPSSLLIFYKKNTHCGYAAV